ncbi:MAG: tRNA-dihydrouridine synthase, partial [Candidatus Woesearchaeota archaeon]
GCDYVMIGRAAIGNPFIFKQIQEYNKKGEYSEKVDNKKVFFEYLELAKKHKIEFKNIKMQAIYFTKGIKNATVMRKEISKAKDIKAVMKIWENIEK